MYDEEAGTGTPPKPVPQMTSMFSSEPYAPQFIEAAGKTAEELKSGATTSAAAQLQRLNDYIKHLYQVRNLAQMSAKGAAARGAGGQQNPLAAYKGMTELARQAGIPIDAEISKTLQSSDNIENTMNQLIGQAGNLQAQLASIAKSGGSGYGNISVGGQNNGRGNGNGQGNGQGDEGKNYIDIRGNVGGPKTILNHSEMPIDPSFGQKQISQAVQTGVTNPANIAKIPQKDWSPGQQQIMADFYKNQKANMDLGWKGTSFGNTDPNKASLDAPQFDITSGVNPNQSMFDNGTKENPLGTGSLQLSPNNSYNWFNNNQSGGDAGGMESSIDDMNHPIHQAINSLPGISMFGIPMSGDNQQPNVGTNFSNAPSSSNQWFDYPDRSPGTAVAPRENNLSPSFENRAPSAPSPKAPLWDRGDEGSDLFDTVNSGFWSPFLD